MRRCWVPGMMVVVAVGCGGSPDAERDPDGDVDAVDGIADTPSSGLVSVTVNSPVRLRALENAPVVFIEPDGTTTRVMTDAMGHAQAMVAPGTSVTVVFEENRGIATILGVQPGDQLGFGQGRIVNGSTVDVTLTAFPGDVDSYRIYTPCFAWPVSPGTTRLTLDLCIGQITSTDVLVVAYKNFTPVASAAAQGVDLTTGAVTVPNTWTTFANLLLDYSNVPQFENVFVNYADTPENYTESANANSPEYDVILSVPSGAQSAYVQTSTSRNSRGSQQILEMLPTGATSYQLDIGAAEQPWLSQVSYTNATRTVAVEVGAGGQSFDVVQYDVVFGFASNPTRWDVYSPDLNGVVLPSLPADLDPTALEFRGAGVTTFEVPMLTGWDAVRPQVYPITAFPPVLPFGRVHLQLLRDQ